MSIEQALIINVIDHDGKVFGFAKLVSDGSEAYIPPSLFKSNDLDVGDMVFADVVPNDSKYHDTSTQKRINYIYDENGPFAHLLPKATVQPAAPAPAPEPKPDPSEAEQQKFITEWLKINDHSFWMTSVITDEISKDLEFEATSKNVGRLLATLHDKGDIAMLALSTDRANKRLSKVAWADAKKANDLFMEWMAE